MKLRFDPCFDRAKVIKISPYLPGVYAELNRRAKWRRGKWPTQIKCMTHDKIVSARTAGAGHGYVYPASAKAIWMNPFMTPQGLLLVLIHENCHVAWPDMTEDEINCSMLPDIWKVVVGKRLDPAWARRHGVGGPQKGIGDRSYCER